MQASAGGGLLADSGVTATAGALTAKKLDGITYANAYATGAGTAVSPWVGFDTAVQAAMTACETVYFPPGYYAPAATLNFVPGCLKESVVVGSSAVIVLSNTVPRAFGFAKTADYDTFQNIDLSGFTIDGGNSTGKGAAIIGTNVAGANLTRVQFKNVYVHDIYAFNVKQDSNVGTNHMGFIQFSPQTTGSESEVLDFENVVIERVTMAGGNWGVLFTGNATNPTKERLSGITVRDCSVDMRPVGAQIATGYYAGTGFHFGGYALGENLTVENLTVYASPDNCYEFNNWQTVSATALRCVNPMVTGFTIKNFTTPTDFKQQRITITNAPVEMTVATPADPDGDGTPQYAPSAFTVTTAASIPMGDVIIRGGEFRQTTGLTTRVGPLVWVAPGASGGIRSVTLDDFKIAAPDMTRDSTQDQYWYPIYWQNKKYDYDGDGTTDRPTLSVHNLDVKINMKKSASGVTAIRGAIGMIEGDANLDYRNVSVDIASNTTNDISGLYIVPSSAAEVSGAVRGYRYRGVDASASVNRYIWAGSTTNLTIADTLVLSDVRSTNGVSSIDATQIGRINIITEAPASGTQVLDPNTTPPTTAAGYYQSGDPLGLQFFPAAGRSRAWALQAKQRNDITSAAGITSPSFAVLGDSVSSWAAQTTLSQLRRRYGRSVLGYRNLADASIYQTPAETISWTGGTKYSAVDTTPSTLEQFGPCGGSYNWTAAANIHYVVNAPNVANTARIYYYCKTGGGTFSWSIYGGGTTNINTGGCSNGTLGVTTITLQGSQLLQPGAVIDLAWVSGNVTLYGIETYAVTNVTNEALNHIEPVWCVQPGTQLATAVSFGTNTLLQSLLTTIAPSEVFVAFGTNDAAASVSASTFQTNLTTMVTTVQGALTGATKGDVVLVTPVPVGNGSHAEAYAATMEGYRTATFAVGTAKSSSVWDARRWWGSFSEMYTLGAYLSDDIHPSNYGRLLWAEAYAYLVAHPGWSPARNNIADTWANDANSAGYVFAAATLSPPDQSNYARVYSSTTITTLNTCNQAYWGREFTLDCHDTATWAIGSGGNIRLNVPFACSGANPATQSITLLCDGNAWIEKSRSPGFSGNYSGANSGTLSNATTWYIPGTGVLTTANSTETNAYVVSPATAVTAASLQCKVGAAVATGTWTFKLRVNGADSALTCAMTSSATSCADTTHTVAVAAGSWLDYSMVPTSTPTAQTYAACSIVY